MLEKNATTFNYEKINSERDTIHAKLPAILVSLACEEKD